VPAYAYLVVIGGWFIWVAPFLRSWARRAGPATVVDRRARWGLILEGIGYGLLWQGRFWERPLPAWRLASSIVFLALACLLSWSAAPALGRQWRIDAGLNSDHQLVTSGPYRVVRHPIYASMLCLFVWMGLMIAPPLLFAIAAVFFIAGTETRVRIEERLLASRFGETFVEYRRRVPAYIPLVR
jgi:protein-S-isoprenylcysteine O-methyltransferase Ste14